MIDTDSSSDIDSDDVSDDVSDDEDECLDDNDDDNAEVTACLLSFNSRCSITASLADITMGIWT